MTGIGGVWAGRAGEYLAARRALGFKLTSFGVLLDGFASSLDQAGATRITTAAAISWAKATARSASEVAWSRRMLVARIFARYWHAFDSGSEIPPPDVLNHYASRRTPFIYSDAQVRALMRAAGVLRPALRAATYQTMIGLAACTGMRIGELCALEERHVDLDAHLIKVEGAKFGKSRLVPLHPSTATALGNYRRTREELRHDHASAAFFINTRGHAPSHVTVDQMFAGLVAGLDLGVSDDGHRPRFHDLRHAMATRTLQDWYEQDLDVEALMPVLATFLGHVDPKSTYWYLTGSPELMRLAACRLETAGLAGEQSNE